jgi:uncharacterized protein Smg (DUF494 family)
MSLLTTGIKNALEKGESLEKITKSFENAGYLKEDINKAVEEMKSWIQTKQLNSNEKTSSKEDGKYKKLPFESTYEVKDKRSYLIYVLIALAGILIIGGAVLLGLYWNQLFK